MRKLNQGMASLTIENILENFAQKLDIIQLHGEENAEYISKLRENCDCEIWKAVRVKCADDIAKADALPVHKLLIDSFSAGSYGGTGKRVDLETTGRLSNIVGDHAVLVSESGIKTNADMKKVRSLGADAVLIGETLMRSGNIGTTLHELREGV